MRNYIVAPFEKCKTNLRTSCRVLYFTTYISAVLQKNQKEGYQFEVSSFPMLLSYVAVGIPI